MIDPLDIKVMTDVEKASRDLQRFARDTGKLLDSKKLKELEIKVV